MKPLHRPPPLLERDEPLGREPPELPEPLLGVIDGVERLREELFDGSGALQDRFELGVLFLIRSPTFCIQRFVRELEAGAT